MFAVSSIDEISVVLILPILTITIIMSDASFNCRQRTIYMIEKNIYYYFCAVLISHCFKYGIDTEFKLTILKGE